MVTAEIRQWEEICANVFPPYKHLLYDGWLLRFTSGYSNHNNSVWPLYEGVLPLEYKIAFCEQQYAAQGSSCTFRLTDSPDHYPIKEQLTRRDYTKQNPNLVMVRPLLDAPEASITTFPFDEWHKIIYRIHPVADPAMMEWERQVLERLTLSGRFAIVTHQNKASGYGYSVLQDRTLLIEDLWILPTLRGQGLGTQLINGLLRLGFEDGANRACLTVNESNTSAQRLYKRVGFVKQYLYYYLAQKE